MLDGQDIQKKDVIGPRDVKWLVKQSLVTLVSHTLSEQTPPSPSQAVTWNIEEKLKGISCTAEE